MCKINRAAFERPRMIQNNERNLCRVNLTISSQPKRLIIFPWGREVRLDIVGIIAFFCRHIINACVCCWLRKSLFFILIQTYYLGPLRVFYGVSRIRNVILYFVYNIVCIRYMEYTTPKWEKTYVIICV